MPKIPKEQRRFAAEIAGGPGLGYVTAAAIGLPVAGVLLIIDGQLWVGLFLLLCGLASIFTAWVFWTRQ